jgi:hypothetical protein
MRKADLKATGLYICRESLKSPDSPRVLAKLAQSTGEGEGDRSVNLMVVKNPRGQHSVGSTFKVAVAQITTEYTGSVEEFSESMALKLESQRKEREEKFALDLPMIKEIYLDDPETFRNLLNL